MSFLRTLGLPLLALALLAGPASAQTKPSTKKKPVRSTATKMVPPRKMAVKRLPDGRKANTSGDNDYAAPGMPINNQDNGKSTPSYNGSAAGSTPAKGTTLPK